MPKLILYSKPGCHLCEGLEEKLRALQAPAFELEIRDITTDPAWFERYQYEVPVLCSYRAATGAEQPLPRLPPKASRAQVSAQLQHWLLED